MEYDQSELLAAMYQSDDDPAPQSELQFDSAGFTRSRKLRIGAIVYEVPTVDYVNRLERLIVTQARTIERQQNELGRLSHFVIATRNFIRRQTLHISEMQRSLEGKVDLRETL